MSENKSLISFKFIDEESREEIKEEEEVTWILPEDPIKRLHRLIREKMNDKPKIITAKTAYFWGRKDGIRKLKLSNMKIVDAALGGTFLNILTQTGDIITLNSIGHDYPLGDPQAIPRPSTKRFIKIAANVNCDHALALDEGGVLWAWGSNSSGQLGIAEDVEGDFSDQNTPVKVILPFSEGIRDIYAGGNGDAGYSYLITEMGRIYSWGSGKCGALGLGDDEDRTSPTLVKRWTAVQSLSIGGSHVLALSIDECVYAVGNNSYKQLGTLASMDNFYFGEVIPLRDEGIIKIAASGFSSLALSKNGTVFAWGRNTEGQCSGYESNPQYVAVPTKIKTLSRVVDITLGWCHGLAYTADEKLYYWGFVKNFDSNGQVEDSFTDVIELKTIPEKPVILRAGCYDTCVLTD